jgi:hypothetical protein
MDHWTKSIQQQGDYAEKYCVSNYSAVILSEL